MAASHLCLSCGHDLARVRPQHEPHYNLRIITCPTCSRVQVRRQHPLRSNIRVLRRLDWTLTVLLGQLVSLLILVAATTATAVGTVIVIYEIAIREQRFAWMPILVFGSIGFFIMPLLTGAWLTAGLAHWQRRSDVWIAWMAGVSIVIVIACVVFVVMQDDPIDLGATILTLRPIESAFAGFILVLPALSVFCVLTAIAWLGVPLGRQLDRLLQMFARWRGALLRKRMRRALGRVGT